MEIRIQVQKILDEYGEKLEKDFDKVVQQVAKETVEELRSTSPRKTGGYANGWTQKKDGQHGRVIYNSAKPGLTHLLNYGHPIANQYGSYGYKAGDGHITKAERNANEKLLHEIEARL